MFFPFARESLIPSSLNNIRDSYVFENQNLGEGNYGFVRPARRISDNAVRAVKIIPKKRIKDNQMLTRQIQLMKHVDHPNIVRLYQTYEDPRYVYLVLQLCTGGELFDRIIQRGSLAQQQAAILCTQMLQAVCYLHNKNIVHRDLKPQNFLFTTNLEDSSLKLIDFGLAKILGPERTLHSRAGTCYYISPETLHGNYNEKSDIWSLGVILFMMLGGYPPFDGDNDRKIIESVRTSNFSFSEPVWQNISLPAKDLIRRMLDRNPDTRISANQALDHEWIAEFDQTEGPSLNIDYSKLSSYQRSKRFKKLVLNYLATQCTTMELADIIRVFQTIDSNRDGLLGLDQIQQALENSENVPRDKVQDIIRAIRNGSAGTINLNQFIAAMLDKRYYLNQEKLWLAFRRFDVENQGVISPDMLRQVLDIDEEFNSPEIWREIISEVDLDGDGGISFEEFERIMERVSIDEVETVRKSIG